MIKLIQQKLSEKIKRNYKREERENWVIPNQRQGKVSNISKNEKIYF